MRFTPQFLHARSRLGGKAFWETIDPRVFYAIIIKEGISGRKLITDSFFMGLKRLRASTFFLFPFSLSLTLSLSLC